MAETQMNFESKFSSSDKIRNIHLGFRP